MDKKTDAPLFAKELAMLAAIFNREIDEILVDAYWRALEAHPIEKVQKAIMLAASASQYFPTPAELLRLTGELKPAERALEAWEAVRRAIGNQGVYTSVWFDDPVTNATIRSMGGWPELCRRPGDHFTRNDFARTYEAKAHSAMRGEMPEDTRELLPGIGCDRGSPGVIIAVGLPPPKEAPRALEAPDG